MTQAASVAGRCRIPDSGRAVCRCLRTWLFGEPFEGLVTARGTASYEKRKSAMRLRLPTINHRLPACQPTARMCGLLDRVGGALVDERERLELKAIEMLKEPKRLVQPEPVDHAWWDDGSGVYSIG